MSDLGVTLATEPQSEWRPQDLRYRYPLKKIGEAREKVTVGYYKVTG